jgi:hypothetical protein
VLFLSYSNAILNCHRKWLQAEVECIEPEENFEKRISLTTWMNFSEKDNSKRKQNATQD